jgi:site-specific DNA-adenine methylase
MILKKYVDKLIITDLSAELVICFIFIIKNRFEEAIRNIKRLVMLYPQNLTLRYHLVFFTQRIS